MRTPSNTRFGRGTRLGVLALGMVLGAALAVPAVALAAGSFGDVPASSPYAKDIAAATSNGVMTGCSKTKFCPKAPATRQELARVANRLGALGTGRVPVANAKTALTAKSALAAATATNADHATTADTATTATSATSASDSTSLGGVPASNYLQKTGQILLTAPNGTWQKFYSSDTEQFSYYSNRTQISATGPSTAFVSNSVSTPSALFGLATSLVGVRLCYEATAVASVSYVEINAPTVDANGAPSQNVLLSDSTARTSNACEVLTLSTPHMLTSASAVNIFLALTWTGSGSVSLTNATFIFAATTTPATPLAKTGSAKASASTRARATRRVSVTSTSTSRR